MMNKRVEDVHVNHTLLHIDYPFDGFPNNSHNTQEGQAEFANLIQNAEFANLIQNSVPKQKRGKREREREKTRNEPR